MRAQYDSDRATLTCIDTGGGLGGVASKLADGVFDSIANNDVVASSSSI
jgi:hypothetical protein